MHKKCNYPLKLSQLVTSNKFEDPGLNPNRNCNMVGLTCCFQFQFQSHQSRFSSQWTEKRSDHLRTAPQAAIRIPVYKGGIKVVKLKVRNMKKRDENMKIQHTISHQMNRYFLRRRFITRRRFSPVNFSEST